MPTVPFLGSYGDISGSGLMFRNRIINGAMIIDQRNVGATITPTTTPSQAGYTLDRWRYFISQSSKLSFARSSVAPVGFVNSLLCTSTSAYSALSADVFQIGQVIEGFNVADLAWGSSDARPITLSFWVRSSLTGLIGGAIVNGDGTRTYPFSYSVISANTWEYKQVVIPGDTSGTWAKDNTAGLRLRFNLGSGSAQLAASGAWTAGDFNGPTGAISVVGTSGATFYLTGVQVEPGSQASSFEFRQIGMELSLCQRYYEKSFAQNVAPASNLGDTRRVVVTSLLSNDTVGYIPFLVTKKSNPNMTSFAAISTGSNWHYWNGSSFTQVSTTLSPDEYRISVGMTIAGTVGQSWMTAGQWTASAEF